MTAKEDLLAQIFRDIGHDFKSPLTAVIGALEVLVHSKGNLPVEQQQKLQELALQEAQRLLHFVENMMLYTRLTSQEITLQLEDLSLADLANAVSSEVQSRHPQLSVDASRVQDFPLRGDRKLLSLVLKQIFDNAARHNKGTAVTVSILPGISGTSFSISDNGSGIAAKDAEHIFSPYNKGMQREHKNTSAGLGLTIARKIMNLHGGSLELKKNGAGDRIPAIFEIVLPI